MKCGLFFIIVAFISILYVEPFLPLRRSHRQRTAKPLLEGATNRPCVKDKLDHSDIIWKVRPTPETSPLKKLWLRLAANLIRLDCKIMGKDVPVVLCPKGGQAVLEAYYRPASSSKHAKIARFGFTTESGPSIPPIRQTVHEIYGLDPKLMVRVGAIIYMFVEEPYRKKNVGVLALDVLSLIHAIQGCDFTVLVADDNGSGRLVEWYLENGYSIAPKLQECFGSPNELHGKTMIAPTCGVLPSECFIKWW
jgi:hypothetical protein